jgi:hypothetical protein
MAVGAGFITAADATIVFTAPPIFTAGQIIAGFAPDDVFQVPQRRLAQVEMGVDGFLASGFIFQLQPWNFTLQAPSPSNDFFDELVAAQLAAKTTFFIQGEVALPSTGRSYLMQNGTLVEYAPAPSARQVLQPRAYGISWANIIPIPSTPGLAA